MLRKTSFFLNHRVRRHLTPAFIVAIIAAFCIFGISDIAWAQTNDAEAQFQQVAGAAGVEQTDIFVIVGRIINVVLGLVGVILVSLMVYAGFLWMTAGGDADKVVKAKNIIRNAMIGLLILVSAFAIVRFILNALIGDGGIGGGVTQPGAPGTFFPSQAGSLGGGIIETHYPMRNATKVARNTSIVITFKIPIKLSSVIAGYNDNGTPDDFADDTVTDGLNDEAIKIYRNDAGESGALTSDKVRVTFTADRKIFVFRQVNCPPEANCLGTSTVDVDYSVTLKGGLNGLLRDDGTPAFGGAFSDGYKWTFQVGTVLDLEPPRVVSATPRPGNQYDRNILVQIRFNEGVDPVSASGFVGTLNLPDFENIKIAAGQSTAFVSGEYRISNQYRTVEFIPAEKCGTNSCGEDVFCLPGGTQIDVVAQSALLDGAGPSGQFLAGGWTGIVDLAANALDGTGDGKTDGQPTDNYGWGFSTTNNINLDPPKIEDTWPPAVPGPGQSNIDPFDPVQSTWDTILQSSSFNTDNAFVRSVYEPKELEDTFWWTTLQEYLTDAGELVERPDQIPAKSKGFVSHRQYATSTEYQPFLLSGIRNQYQNCFNPAASAVCQANPSAPNCCQSSPGSQACETRTEFNP